MAVASKTRTPVEIVREAFEALDERDLDRLAESWADDVVEDFIPLGTFRGKPAVREYFAGVFAALPDLRVEVLRIAGEDETVFVLWRMTGTFDGAPFQGIEPTGKPIDLRGMDCFTIRDGKVAENVIVFDGADYGRQIGMLPPRDSTADRAMTAAFNGVTKLRGRLRG